MTFELFLYAVVIYFTFRLVTQNRQKRLLKYRVTADTYENTIVCKIEQHGTILYLWGADGKFFTQAITIEELNANCEKFFPKFNFVVENAEVVK